MFSDCTVPPDNKETELGSSDQEASQSVGKNTGGSFSAMFAHGSASLQLFPVVCVDISEVPGCHLLRQMSSQ